MNEEMALCNYGTVNRPIEEQTKEPTSFTLPSGACCWILTRIIRGPVCHHQRRRSSSSVMLRFVSACEKPERVGTL